MTAAIMNDSAEDLRMLRDSAVQFTARSTDHKRTRALRETLPGYDARMAASMAELGWCGLLVPEAQGGLELGLSEMAAVLQELGKGLLAEPLVAQVALPVLALRHCGNSDDSLTQRLLSGMSSGELKVALASISTVGRIATGPDTRWGVSPGLMEI